MAAAPERLGTESLEGDGEGVGVLGPRGDAGAPGGPGASGPAPRPTCALPPARGALPHAPAGRGALCGPRGLSHPVPDKAVSCLLGSSRAGA